MAMRKRMSSAARASVQGRAARVERNRFGLEKVTKTNPNPRSPKKPTLSQRIGIAGGTVNDAGSIRYKAAGLIPSTMKPKRKRR